MAVFSEEPDWEATASIWYLIDDAYKLNQAARDELFSLATMDGVPWIHQPWKLRVCRIRIFRITKHLLGLDGYIMRIVEDRGASAPPWIRAEDAARLPTRMKRLLNLTLVRFPPSHILLNSQIFSQDLERMRQNPGFLSATEQFLDCFGPMRLAYPFWPKQLLQVLELDQDTDPGSVRS